MNDQTSYDRGKSLDPGRTTLICPDNDLEARTIIALCRKKLKALDVRKLPEHDRKKHPGLDIRVSSQRWGATLQREPDETFIALRKNVVIVEIPGPERENELRKKGHRVFCVDHHCYPELNRHADESSLEQIAKLFNLELSDEERLIACNDRGYVYEMMRVLVNGLLKHHGDSIDLDEAAETIYAQVSRIRKLDLEAQGVGEEDLKRANDIYESNHIDFPNFTLVITREKKSSPIADRHCIPGKDEIKKYIQDRMKGALEEKTPPAIKNLVIVTENEEGSPIKISLSGTECFMGSRFKIVLDRRQGAGRINEFNFWHNGNVYDGSKTKNFYGGIEPAKTDTDSLTEFGKLIDEIFRVLLRDHPFLEKYSTIFVYPFTLESNKKVDETNKWEMLPFNLKAGEDGNSDEDSLQEYLYFHGYVREFLYEIDGDDPSDHVHFFKYKSQSDDGGDFEVSFIDDQWRKRTLNYPITHVGIHRYYYDVCLLVLQVTRDIDASVWNKFKDEHKPGWRDFVEVARKGLFVEQAMSFNSFARILYQSFKEQRKEHKLPLYIKLTIGGDHSEDRFEEGNWSMSASKDGTPRPCRPIRELVESFCCSGRRDRASNYTGILDDRMFVHTYFCYSSYCNLDAESRRKLFSRILYVDPYGYDDEDGFDYAYDPEFVEELMEPLLYERFKHYRTLYGFSRFSSVFTMYSGYYSKIVIFRHFNAMYYQMSLLALYYRSVLVKFSKKIGEATSELIDKNESKARKSFKELREKFLHFSNRYWFRELTHQDQGIEIFNLQRKALGLEEMFEQVTSEVEKTDEYLENKSISKIESRSLHLSIIAGWIALLALILGFYSMQPQSLSKGASYLCEIWQEWPGMIIMIMLGLAVGLIFIVTIIFLVRWRRNI